MDETNDEYLGAPDDTTCSVCYAEFLEPEDLNLHIVQNHGKKSENLDHGEITMEIALGHGEVAMEDATSHNMEQVTSHQAPLDHGEICMEVLSSEDATGLEQSKVTCHFCEHLCSDYENYALHIRDDHINEISWCEYCQRVFSNSSLQEEHKKKHFRVTKRNSYSCSQCDSQFIGSRQLIIHERTVHKCKNADGFNLQIVFPFLSSVLSMEVQTFLLSKNKSYPYICEECHYKTTLLRDYVDHLKEKKCRTVVCDNCSIVYRFQKTLSRHLVECRRIKNDGSDLKSCPQCDVCFNKKLLRKHMKYCNIHMCSTCKQEFKSVQALALHKSTAHTLRLSVEGCVICRREFVSEQALNVHFQKVHESQMHAYKYKCVYCDKRFKHPKNLFGHIYSTHKDIKPYTCEICNVKFKSRIKFTYHIKLEHKSVGFVQSDEKFNVFFREKKLIVPQESTQPDQDDGQVKDSTDTLQYTKSGVDERKGFDSNKMKLNPKQELRLVNSNINEKEIQAVKVSRPKQSLNIRKTKFKKQPKFHSFNKKEIATTDSESDNEPLLAVRNRVRSKSRRAIRMKKEWSNNPFLKMKKTGQNKFTCKICSKYCYTYENYQNHIKQHSNKLHTCIKCLKEFKTNNTLVRHMKVEHSSSKLTETLKLLLERRRSGVDNRSMAEKFRSSIKKVSMEVSQDTAVLIPVSDDLSVQTFIENFTPEANAKKKINAELFASLKPVEAPFIKEPIIKMHKVDMVTTDLGKPGLAKPVPYKQILTEQPKITVKLLQNILPISQENDTNNTENYVYFEEETYEDDMDNNETIIPDIGEEVMLEDSKQPRLASHKLVIPKVVKYEDLRIAHLMPKAPFYKIVKVKDMIEEKKPEIVDVREKVKLPGAKLVNVNPLAHLLKDKGFEAKPKKAYYQPKLVDYENAIAKALLNLKQTNTAIKKSKKKIEMEQ